MRAELDINPEIQAELEFIENGITEGIASLSVSNTVGLCHQINWAIAYRLNQSFGWDILDYKPHHLRQRNPVNPYISYVTRGEIFTGTVKRHHSFPLLIGVSPDILLLDGANDQTDPEKPFLVAGIGSSFFQEIKSFGHKITEKPPIFFSAMASLEEYYPQALEICLNHSFIDQSLYDEAMRQFKIEKDAGLFYLIGFNRDIVTHFMSALGVHYPSTQPVQNALKRLLNELGIKADDIFK